MNFLQVVLLTISGVAIAIILIILASRRDNKEREERSEANAEKRRIKQLESEGQYERKLFESQRLKEEAEASRQKKYLKEEHSVEQKPLIQVTPVFEIEEKFPALRFFVGLIKTIAILSAILGYVVSGMFIAGGVHSSLFSGVFTEFKIVTGIIGILISTTIAVLIYSYADFIQCVVDIEHNTRQTAFNTRRDDHAI
jgi:quaternary ammonium compound-resistance protein SugE